MTAPTTPPTTGPFTRFTPFTPPTSADPDPRAGLGTSGAVVADEDRDSGSNEQVVHLVEVVPDLYPAVRALCDAHAEGGQVLVLTQPNLVDAVVELLRHEPDAIAAPVSSSDDSAEHSTLTTEVERLIAAEHLLAQHLPTMHSMDRIGLVIDLQKILEGRS